MEIDKMIFRHFVRINYKDIEIENYLLDGMCVEFNEYLNKNVTEDKLANFIPKSTMEVCFNSNHPLKHNGYHPALLLHFDNFIKLMMSQE